MLIIFFKGFVMKSLIFMLMIFIGMSGCGKINMDSLASQVLDTAVDTYSHNDGHVDTGRTDPKVNYSTKPESFYITEAKRSSKNFGKVSIVDHVANPDKVTRVMLQSAKQKDSGGRVKGSAYLFPVSKEGWLVNKPVTLHKVGKEGILNSGVYYVKATDSSWNLYASGEVKIQSGKTNILTVSVE